MTKLNLKIFAVDDGHFNNKGASLVHQNIQKVLCPTLLTNSKNTFEDMTNNGSVETYLTEHQIGNVTRNKAFTALRDLVPGQNLVDTNTNDYQTSGPSRVMVNHMLRMLGAKSSDQIVLVTSSPIKRFYVDGEKNTSYINARKENFMKPVFIEGIEEPMHNIVTCLEVPEALGAFYNDCINIHSKGGKTKMSFNQDLINKNSLYIDIGGRTTDTAVVQSGNVMKDHCHTFENSGMLAIHEKLRVQLKTYRNNLTRLEIDKIIDTGQFTPDLQNAKTKDVSDIVNDALESVLEPSIDRILSMYQLGEYHRIKFIGGTSLRLREHIQRYVPNAEISTNALYDNVCGMLKYAESQKGQLVKDLEVKAVTA